MTILHLTWLPHHAGYEGILHKLQDLSAGAQAAGVDLAVRVLSHEAGPLITAIPRLTGGRLRKMAAMAQAVDFAAYEAVILRYPGAVDVSAPRILAQWGRRIITEHHTDEIAELRDLPGGAVRVAVERFAGRHFLGQVAGAVAVTGELAARLPGRGLRGPTAVIANGIAVDQVPWTPAPVWTGDGPLRLGFVSGVFWAWQGLDRLLAGLLAAPPGCVEVHLLGRVVLPQDLILLERCHRERPGQVIVHGPVDRSTVHTVLSGMHGAVSTLALHRKGMTEACPIKSREMLARGLPLVAAYLDPDVPASRPGVLTLAAEEGPIDLAAIMQTWRTWATVPTLSADLRRFAEVTLDAKAKAKALVTFARQCVRP